MSRRRRARGRGAPRRGADRAVGGDQVPGEQHTLRPQRVPRSVVVDPRLGRDHEAGGPAHATERDRGRRALDEHRRVVVGEHEGRAEHHQVAVAPVDVARRGVQQQAGVARRRERPVRSRVPSARTAPWSRGRARARCRSSCRARARRRRPRRRRAPRRGRRAGVAPSAAARATRSPLAQHARAPRRPPPLRAPLCDHVKPCTKPVVDTASNTVAAGAAAKPNGTYPLVVPLPGGHDVGTHPPVVDAEPAACAAHAGHDLVGDHQHSVATADLDDDRPVVLARHGGAEGRAGHRFRDEGGDRVRGRLRDHALELGRVPRAARLRDAAGSRTGTRTRRARAGSGPATGCRACGAVPCRSRRAHRGCCRGRRCAARSRRTATARRAPGDRRVRASARSRRPRCRPTPGTAGRRRSGAAGASVVGVALERAGREHRAVHVLRAARAAPRSPRSRRARRGRRSRRSRRRRRRGTVARRRR